MAGRRRAWRAGGGDGALLEGSSWGLTRAAETGELGEAEAARWGAMEVDGAEKSQARCGAWGSAPTTMVDQRAGGSLVLRCLERGGRRGSRRERGDRALAALEDGRGGVGDR